MSTNNQLGVGVPYANAQVVKSDVLVETTVPKPEGKRVLVRINKVQILGNFDFLSRSEVRLAAFVVDSNPTDPVQFFHNNLPFPKVKKDEYLSIGDKGVAIYYSAPEEYPEYLYVWVVVVEDDQDVRDVGDAIAAVRKSDGYKNILAAAKVLAGAANPTAAALFKIGDELAGLLGSALEQNKDDVVALHAATYTRAFDNLGIGKHSFHKDGGARGVYEILVQ